jgi:hypothetical protein
MSDAATDLGVVAGQSYTDPTPAPAPPPNSPEAAAQATEWLARESARLRGAANDDPAVKMSKMLNDRDFMARINGGSAEAHREWAEAMAAAVAQANTPETERLGRQHLDEMGFGGKAAEEIMNGEKFPPEQVRSAHASKTLHLQDREWVDRYMRGGLVEMHDMTLWNAIISSDIEG